MLYTFLHQVKEPDNVDFSVTLRGVMYIYKNHPNKQLSLNHDHMYLLTIVLYSVKGTKLNALLLLPFTKLTITENAAIASLPPRNELRQCNTKSDCSPNSHAGD